MLLYIFRRFYIGDIVMDARAVLVDFFSHHPEYLTLATEGYPSHNPDHVDMWEDLFRHVYAGESPTDVEHVDFPLYRRLGSTDPRWDSLIPKDGLGFGRAVSQFLNEYMCGSLRIPPIQEAA